MRILRSVGKTCLAAAYSATHSPSSSPLAPFIICYHRVVENFDQSAKIAIPSMLISTEMLGRHIDWLAKRFSFVSLDDLERCMESRRQFSRPVAAITFDDGYGDVYHHGFPLLLRKGVPAAVFVVTDLVGTGRPQLFDRLYLLLRLGESRKLPLGELVSAAARGAGVAGEIGSAVHDRDGPLRVMTLLLKRLPRGSVENIVNELQRDIPCDETASEELAPLTWGMIRKMHDSGITIGSHTRSHALLTSESLETAEQELLDSKTVLESKLKGQISHFAYPDGRFNSTVVQAVHSTGYRFAYSICQQRDPVFPLLTIPRKVLWERACMNAWGGFSSAIMNCHAHAAFDRKDRCEHDHSVSGGKNGTID
jgi:peptidoglycan/xylan/chitin deacetylase (PgdA/CDA1 family)